MDHSEELDYVGNLDMGEFMADNDADGMQDEDDMMTSMWTSWRRGCGGIGYG
jgi:hypothetical protein